MESGVLRLGVSGRIGSDPGSPPRRSVRSFILQGLFALLLPACTFEPPRADLPPGPLPFGLQMPPVATLVGRDSKMVFEDPGALVAYQGRGCAETDESGEPVNLLVRQSQRIPREMERAAVILSGWQFLYRNGDHELAGLATGIFDIRRVARDDGSHHLEWQAFGVIQDQNFDDPFRWCYTFTVLAWDSDAYAVQIDQRNTRGFLGDPQGRNVPFGWETALQFHPSFVEPLPYGGTVGAVLPRGFGFTWPEVDEDHNLLQLAYNLDPGAAFIADDKEYTVPRPDLGGTDQAGRNYFSWETKTIFKDNALRRDYFTGELVSIASGPGLEAVHPPFTIVPREDHDNCVSFGGPRLVNRSIGSIPFDVAIPVLTGWDLSYVCDDQHVEEIGIWIETFAYDPGQPGPRHDGRLDYRLRSVLRDAGGGNADLARHRITLLGFRKLPPVVPEPSLSILPDVLRFPYPDHLGRPATTRNALLSNFGSAAATRTDVSIIGPDAGAFEMTSQHAATRPLAPGEDEQFTVRLNVPCGGVPGLSWSATLRIETSEGVFDVPLAGQPYACPAPGG